jgi:hypothetical protein
MHKRRLEDGGNKDGGNKDGNRRVRPKVSSYQHGKPFTLQASSSTPASSIPEWRITPFTGEPPSPPTSSSVSRPVSPSDSSPSSPFPAPSPSWESWNFALPPSSWSPELGEVEPEVGGHHVCKYSGVSTGKLPCHCPNCKHDWQRLDQKEWEIHFRDSTESLKNRSATQRSISESMRGHKLSHALTHSPGVPASEIFRIMTEDNTAALNPKPNPKPNQFRL